MQTSAPSPAAHKPPRSRARRFLGDLWLTVVVSTGAAVVLTLAGNRPLDMGKETVYSLCIGLVALLIVDGVRLSLWHDAPRQRWRISFLLLLVAAAPVAHFVGVNIASLLLGAQPPSLATYLTMPRASMILFTLLATCALAVLIANRERLDRVKLEHSEARARAEAVERQALQAQLRLLQAQIEPHMLFNTLANLQGLIAIDPDRAGRMLDQLIQYLRATLSVSRMETTTLEQEFAAIDAYLGLMQVRMGERLAYRCLLPDALRGVRLPTMLLQPLVENAIVHGLEPKVDGGMVTIEASRRGELLDIAVVDTGLGLDASATRRGGGNGVGVSTTRERLQALYGERASLDLSPAAPHGTAARLTLPLEFA